MLAIWRTRPSKHLTVEMLSTGSVKVSGSEYSKSTLSDVLSREHKWRRVWRMNDEIIHLLHDSRMQHSDVIELIELIELGRAAGFERFVFASRPHADATTSPSPVLE